MTIVSSLLFYDFYKVVEYMDGFQYKGTVLGFFPTAEGYVQRTAPKGREQFNYVYNYTDHLGNVRVSYTKDPVSGLTKIVEENNYYPFGLKHANYNSYVPVNTYNYKFQGQERQDEFELGWDSFKWRNYDYAIGRFMSIDPLAEKYAYQSPYNFAENRVIDSRELEGLEGIHYTKTDSYKKNIHIIEKNVVVLTKLTDPSYSDKKNNRILSDNKNKMNNVKNELANYYSNAKNSKAEDVVFKFNVTEIQTSNTNGGNVRDLLSMAKENGQESSAVEFEGGPNKVAPAAIITTDSPKGSLGKTFGNIKVTTNGESGTTAHEVGHTLLTRSKEDDYPNGNGGLMDSPPGHINNTEVDNMINDSYER